MERFFRKQMGVDNENIDVIRDVTKLKQNNSREQFKEI
jgi:hypothetical protein